MSQIYFSDSAPTKSSNTNTLDSFGRFISADLESEFRTFSHASDIGHSKLVMILSMAFMPLLLNDYLFHGASPVFWQLAAFRAIVFAISIAALIAVRVVSIRTFDIVNIVWAASVIGLDLFIVTARPPGFFGAIASTSFLISVLFLLVPQPLFRQMLLAGAVSVGHLILSLWFYPIADPVVWNTFLLVIFASNAVGFFASRAMQIAKRSQFVLGKQLAASEKHYRTLVQANRGLVWTMRSDKTLEFASQSYVHLASESSSPTNLDAISTLIHADDHSAFTQRVDGAIAGGGEMDWTGRMMNSDGEYRWVLTQMFPLEVSSGKPDKWLGTTTDIHESWTAKIELGELNDELEKSLSRVRQLEKLLSICSFCKKIRDENGQWQNIESYISNRSETRFSHGVCASCGAENYGDIWENTMSDASN